MDIFCCKVLEYLYVYLSACSLKCTGAVILAVCSREYRNKYTRFCHFMFAYIDAVCFVKGTVICLDVLGSCCCFKYILQSSFPCGKRLFQSDLCITVGELRIIRNLTDHSIGNGKLTDFSIRNLTDDIAECRSKEISWIKVMLDLYTHAVTKGHLADCSSDSMTVKCICGDHTACLDILV